MRRTSFRVAVRSVAALAALAASVSAADQSGTASPTLVPLDMFEVPEGLQVTLWAHSPLLKNPTNIDIDAAGRIWVAEGVNYRRHQDRDPKGDRIVVLEDTDGDGRADRATTFVQEPALVAPLGIAVVGNKVIVSNAPDLIVYTDVDENLRFDPHIDKREVLLTGFDGRNHDHALHSVTFGPDGRWYFNAGNAGAHFTDRSGRTFRIGSLYNPIESGAIPVFGFTPHSYAGARSDDGHVYVGGFAARMQPDGTHVEIIGHNFRNSYEQTISSFGDIFHNDNDDPPACRTTFLMEYGNLGYFSRDGQRYWNADRRPGQSIPVAHWRQDDPGVIPAGDVYGGGAPTGIVINEGDALGEKWRGVLLSAEAARNTIFGYFPEPDGAGYALERFDFLTSNKEQAFAGTDFKGGRVTSEIKTFFRPSDVAVGADGAIYIADWFDPRVGGHDDKDTATSGAIYRVAPKNFVPRVPRFDLDTIEGQIAALRSPAVNVRALGFMKLHERGQSALPAVAALLDDENPFIRARAVWLLAQLGPKGVEHVKARLSSRDPMERIAAYRALRVVNSAMPKIAARLAHDPSPAVRREVALSLRDVPFEVSGDILLTLAKGYDGKDRAYLEAWGIGATNKEQQLYAALQGSQPDPDPAKWPTRYADLVWRLTPPDAVPAFATRAKADALDSHERTKAITALGFIATRAAAEALLDIAQRGTADLKENPALWWLINYKDSRWAGFGVDAELKRRGLYDPDAIEINEITVPALAREAVLPPIVEIAKLQGDRQRGAGVARACLMCHRIENEGVDYGPALDGFARRQTRQVVIRAIVDPSHDIAHGYEGTELILQDGKKIHGIVLSDSNPVIVQSTGGAVQMIPASAIQHRQRLERSLMLSADELGLTPQQIADIVAYLE